MNMRFRKVLCDLRTYPGRIALVVLALVVGLTGLGSVLVSYTILSHDLNANFAGTLPPHAAITSKGFARLDLTALRNRPEIENAEFRDFATLRIETHPNEWIPLWLFGVEDFGLLEVFARVPEDRDPTRSTHLTTVFDYMLDRASGRPIRFDRVMRVIASDFRGRYG